MATQRDPLRRHLEEEWIKKGAPRQRPQTLAEREKEWGRPQPTRQPTLGDLLALDIIDDYTMLGDFTLLAEACEEIWRKPTPSPGAKKNAGVNFVAVSTEITARFKAFRDYLHKAMKTPLDFFRLLKLASRPTDPVWRPTCKWNGVWEELYLLVVACGRQKAIGVWRNLPTQDAHNALKAAAGPEIVITLTAVDAARDSAPKHPGSRWRRDEAFTPTSRDWGFHPDDAQIVYSPLLLPGSPKRSAALLRARMWLHHKGASGEFDRAQDIRRIATIYALFRNLNLLTELDVIDLSEKQVAETKASPLEVVNRVWIANSHGLVTKYWVGVGESDLFTVLWIDGTRSPAVYIDLPPFPGHVFKTSDGGALSSLARDDVARRVAQSLEALTTLAIAYLIVLGFAFDIITAGAASAGLRGLLLAYLREKVAEAIVDKGLEAANINNPALNFAVQMGAGMFTGAPGKALRGLDAIERAEQKATRAASKIRPAAPEATLPPVSAAKAADAPPAPTLTTPVRSAQPHVSSHDPDAVPALTREMWERIDAQDAWQYAKAEDGIVATTTRKLREMVESAAEFPAPARLAAIGDRGTGANLIFSKGGLSKSKGSALAGGGKGVSSKAAKKAAAAAKNGPQLVKLFASSPAYKQLDKRLDYLTPGDGKELSKLRQSIRQQLNKGHITLAQANEALKHNVVNPAKELTGEAIAESLVRSEPWPVLDTMAIPTRGASGAPMLDLVARHGPSGPYRFTIVEAKGGLYTALGDGVKRFLYKMSGGKLVPGKELTERAKQATGEWYYHKFAEIYMWGQKAAGSAKAIERAEGERAMKMAIDFVEAARRGEVRFVVVKSSPVADAFLRLKDVDTAFFKRPFKPTKPGEFPLPQSMKPE